MFNLNKETGDILFAHVMVAELVGQGKKNADKYVGSKVNQETGVNELRKAYTTTQSDTAKLRHGMVYLDTSMNWHFPLAKTHHSVPAPSHSPFGKKNSPKLFVTGELLRNWLVGVHLQPPRTQTRRPWWYS